MLKIIYEKELDNELFPPEELADMTDAEIKELLNEDIGHFLEGGTWTIER